MNRRAILPLLLGTPILAMAGETDQLTDPEEGRLARLCSQSPKLGLPQLRDYLRNKLDVAYEIALASAMDPDHRKAIEAAQKHWLEFYEPSGQLRATTPRVAAMRHRLRWKKAFITCGTGFSL